MRSLSVFVAIALIACGSPPTPNLLVPESLRSVSDPTREVAARLDAMAPLLDAVDEGDSEARDNLEDLAREVSGLMDRDEFATDPVRAGLLRTRILFVTDEDAEERRSAYEDSRLAIRGFIAEALTP